MRIRSVRHKGLRKLILKNDTSGLPAASVDRIRNQIAFLQSMASEDELTALATWKPHKLGGDRAGTWSLHVTKNWRLTFIVDGSAVEIIDLNYEDYH